MVSESPDPPPPDMVTMPPPPRQGDYNSSSPRELQARIRTSKGSDLPLHSPPIGLVCKDQQVKGRGSLDGIPRNVNARSFLSVSMTSPHPIEVAELPMSFACLLSFS